MRVLTIEDYIVRVIFSTFLALNQIEAQHFFDKDEKKTLSISVDAHGFEIKGNISRGIPTSTRLCFTTFLLITLSQLPPCYRVSQYHSFYFLNRSKISIKNNYFGNVTCE